MIRVGGNSNGAAHLGIDTVNRKGLAQGLRHSIGQDSAPGQVAGDGESELAGVDATNLALFGCAAGQPLRHALQQTVARGPAIGVIEKAKVVQRQVHHTEGSAFGVNGMGCLVQHGFKTGSAEQTGQIVMYQAGAHLLGHFLELCRQAFADAAFTQVEAQKCACSKQTDQR